MSSGIRAVYNDGHLYKCMAIPIQTDGHQYELPKNCTSEGWYHRVWSIEWAKLPVIPAHKCNDRVYQPVDEPVIDR